jgi:uncharacterized protein YggE
MRQLVFLLAASVLVPALGVPAAASEIVITTEGPVVELNVNEVVRSAPDVAMVNAGVMTRAATAREAIRENAAQMDRLISAMRALGIAREDIQTSNFNLSPNYDYNRETGEQVFRGYNVNNQVSVKLRELSRAGEVLDALVDAGANNIYGPNFMLEDDAEAKETARRMAFERGLAQATEFARMAGFSSVRLLSVAESFQGYGPVPEQAIQVTASRSADVSTPIEPGQVGTGVMLSLKYEMVR